MLHFVIQQHRFLGVTTTNVFNFRADNCPGQNKNQFMLFRFLWCVVNDLENIIDLRFLVAGYEKHSCYTDFGHDKRRPKHTDIFSPRDMMQLIYKSSKINEVVTSTVVRWFNCKTLLSQYFSIARTLNLTRYHIFRFEVSSPGVGVGTIKRVSTSE